MGAKEDRAYGVLPDRFLRVSEAVLQFIRQGIKEDWEVMATRNILHISKLKDFEDFLESKGYMILATSRNSYEVLRARKDKDTVIVYQKANAKEHLSTMDKDYKLVREFIKSQSE